MATTNPLPNQERVTRFSRERLESFVQRAFEEVGVPPDAAIVTATHLLDADLRGVDTHGIVRLPLYVGRIQRGAMRADAAPEVVQETRTTATVDAHNALGQVAAHNAMELAIAKAKENHLAMVTVRNSNHYGAAAGYAMMAAEKGMIGISSTNTTALMAPPGGTEKRIGNNPLSIAVPTKRSFPMVLDVAFSLVAAWNLVMAQQSGATIPLSWALDQHGQPTTDPHAGFPQGSLRSVGEHKGTGLALMMDVLTGVLSGGHFGMQPRGLKQDGAMQVAHFALVIDIEGFMPSDRFLSRVDELIDVIKSSPPVPGVENVLIPGEPEFLKQLERRSRGIPVPAWLLEELHELADEFGIERLPEVA